MKKILINNDCILNTEKSNCLLEKNKISIIVNEKFSKNEVKKAVLSIFSVKITKINSLPIFGRERKLKGAIKTSVKLPKRKFILTVSDCRNLMEKIKLS